MTSMKTNMKTNMKPNPLHRLSPVAWSLSAAFLLVTACKPPETKASDDEIPTRVVRLATVERGDVVEKVELTGELQGIDEVRVLPQLNERIVSLHVKDGDKVAKGTLLAVLEGELLSAGESQALAGLQAAQANLAAVEDNLRRTRGLAEVGAVPPSQLEALEQQKLAAEAQVRQLQAGATQASTQRSRGRITSPIAGVVTGLVLRPGDMASPAQPLLTVVRQDTVKAVMRVAERSFLRIEPGMPATISPLARPEQQVQGEVTLKGPVVDRMTRTGLVEVQLDNRNGALLAGSSIRAGIELGRRPNVVLVPSEAVLFRTETDRTGKADVFVAEGNIAKKREVRVGVRQEGVLELTDGLAEGERIVIQGAAFLRDNNPIEIQDDSPGASAGGVKEAGGETRREITQ